MPPSNSIKNSPPGIEARADLAGDEIPDAMIPSFVRALDEPGTFGNHFDFWSVAPVGDDEADYSRGESLAREALQCSEAYGNSAAISLPIIEMIVRGRVATLEIVFINCIARAARAGALN